LSIAPEGFEQTHKRGGGKHRLNADAHKWEPFGIGTETSPQYEMGEPIAAVNEKVI